MKLTFILIVFLIFGASIWQTDGKKFRKTDSVLSKRSFRKNYISQREKRLKIFQYKGTD